MRQPFSMTVVAVVATGMVVSACGSTETPIPSILSDSLQVSDSIRAGDDVSDLVPDGLPSDRLVPDLIPDLAEDLLLPDVPGDGEDAGDVGSSDACLGDDCGGADIEIFCLSDEDCAQGFCEEDTGECLPCSVECQGLQCGEGQCGNDCGQCVPGYLCEEGVCLADSDCGNGLCELAEDCSTCPADCACEQGLVCEDGKCMNCTLYCSYRNFECGLHLDCDCGVCEQFPNSVCEEGQCSCTPDCAGKQCGLDGCGWTCGECSEDLACVAGVCALVPECGDGQCTVSESCSTCAADCACEAGDLCFDNSCMACSEFCQATEKECGVTWGCDCGTCAGGLECQEGSCVCIPDCFNKECGEDGCGGDCGACDEFPNSVCQAGVCACLPQCSPTSCGSNGCGGFCCQTLYMYYDSFAVLSGSAPDQVFDPGLDVLQIGRCYFEGCSVTHNFPGTPGVLLAPWDVALTSWVRGDLDDYSQEACDAGQTDPAGEGMTEFVDGIQVNQVTGCDISEESQCDDQKVSSHLDVSPYSKDGYVQITADANSNVDQAVCDESDNWLFEYKAKVQGHSRKFLQPPPAAIVHDVQLAADLEIWPLDGWQRRRPVEINAFGNESEGYQLYVEFPLPVGMAGNCSDLRFTDSEGNSLPFYLQECSSQGVKTYVRVDLQ